MIDEAIESYHMRLEELHKELKLVQDRKKQIEKEIKLLKKQFQEFKDDN